MSAGKQQKKEIEGERNHKMAENDMMTEDGKMNA
jgi:hypothetical protein